ncbi:translation initiation factor if-2 betam beta subunit [Stylonychia lemnae]|uniref:Translation initiation factor if-2 betam beta subunit n=1 Tax=Stylonychia lemnae TaxID=5949 RepID=A0A078AIP2_STYLE|nr:translation initiation factor if-2 betam beta subunit [Stylonychia lemnae]|eukprot:CDW81801.1 translation initiation factor if-2 betam beta subunit [Stylonychia lemnae]
MSDIPLVDQPNDEDVEIIDFSTTTKTKKKKKKASKKSKAEKAAEEGDDKADQKDQKTSLLVAEGHVEYNYQDMLTRIQQILIQKNILIGETSKLNKNEDPYVVKLGTTKTAWQNFDTMVTAIDRKHDHLLSFISTELGVEGVLGGENNLILQGKFQGKHIERLYKKYMEQYVRCHNCKQYQTKLDKDPSTRLYMLECKLCGSTRSVAAIKAGFHAVKKGERKKAR